MTTDAKPRIKITYATLRPTTRSSTRASRRRVARVRAELGGAPPELHRRRLARRRRRRFEVRSPIDRDLLLGTFATGTVGRCRRRRRRRPGRPAGLGRDPVARAARDPAPRRRADQRPPDGRRRDHGYRGRQEPDRGARRGRGSRPTCIRYYAQTDGGQRRLRPPDGQPRRRDRPHPLDPAAARRVRRRQPVQLPDGPRRRPDGRRAARRQHGRAQAVERVAAVGGQAHRGVHRRRRPGGRRSTS